MSEQSTNPIPAGFIDPRDHVDARNRWNYAAMAEAHLRQDWQDDGSPGMLQRAIAELERAGFNTTILTIHCNEGVASVYPFPN